MHELIDVEKHSDLIYDVGMHKGEDAEFYLRKGFRVVAFEANPDLVSHCKKRLRQFIDQNKLVIIEGAIVAAGHADGRGKVQFYRNRMESVWGTVQESWAQRNENSGAPSDTLDVDVVDFAAVLQEKGIPHYLKVDIEGCDMVCVEALKQFRHRPSYLSIESSKSGFAAIRHELAALRNLGYDHFQAVEQSGIPTGQESPFPSREGGFVPHHFEDGSSGLFGGELEDRWLPFDEMLRQYRAIVLGYYLLGDRGFLNRFPFRKLRYLRGAVRRCLSYFTGAAVPGWYDTHARHSTVSCNVRH